MRLVAACAAMLCMVPAVNAAGEVPKGWAAWAATHAPGPLPGALPTDVPTDVHTDGSLGPPA